jgi:hypothetical protein
MGAYKNSNTSIKEKLYVLVGAWAPQWLALASAPIYIWVEI